QRWKFKYNGLNRVKKIDSIEITNNFQNSVAHKKTNIFLSIDVYLAVIIPGRYYNG
ncbi:hypothetical protein GVA55_002266, partial [Salmonella enterica]|nr:hypothetical protein [Salmonella enterica]